MGRTHTVANVIEKKYEGVTECGEIRSQLLPVLQKIQEKKGYIPNKDMQEIADKLCIHPVEVYSVVTFYSFLTTKKKGRHIIRVSNCISNELAGSKKIINAFEKILKIKAGETTKDKKITLELTGCLGMCDQSPAIMVDDKLIGKVTPKMVEKIIKGYRKI